MKKSNFSKNLWLIRDVWSMNRLQISKYLNCTEKQIGGYERGTTAIPPAIVFTLEELTGVAGKRLYYDVLTRSSIPNQPLSPSEILEVAAKEAPPQYNTDNLSIAERVKRLELKVFGA
jgi:hypothetical protein